MSDPSNGRKMDGTFQEGWKGGGRPKMPEHLKKAFQETTPQALEALKNILNGTDETARAGDRIRAAEVLLDRSWGKPVQAIDADIVDNRQSIDISKLTQEQKDALVSLAAVHVDDGE